MAKRRRRGLGSSVAEHASRKRDYAASVRRWIADVKAYPKCSNDAVTAAFEMYEELGRYRAERRGAGDLRASKLGREVDAAARAAIHKCFTK